MDFKIAELSEIRQQHEPWQREASASFATHQTAEGRHLQRVGGTRRCAGSAVHRQQLHQGPPLLRRRKGGLAHGIGRTKGRRNTKLHAVCGEKGRPCVLLLTPGNVNDCRVAKLCIEAMPPSAELVADKGYDSQALREWLVERDTQSVIRPARTAKVQYHYNRAICKQRNVVERMWVQRSYRV
ncbi:transposase [Phyllobacterium sp. K27]